MSARKAKSGAFWVGLGIFLSRIAGFVRERVFAMYFGNSDAADAFKAAFKIPNLLQNLFGEGVLSASFIPVYARLLADGDEEAARRLAGQVLAVLMFLMAILAVAGIGLTPFLIDVVAPGFAGEKRELAIQLVQIFFPATAILVLSAWCLGVLNSHRRFFLSYVAPVLWNAVIIATLICFGGRITDLSRLAVVAAYGLLGGSLAQLLVQWPLTLKLLGALRLRLDRKGKAFAQVSKNFTPVVIARGVVQVSAYVDNMLASLLPTGAVAAISYAQTIYLVPVSLFGMSVAASQLPEMASVRGNQEEMATKLREQLAQGMRNISFFVVPSVFAFLIYRREIVALLFQGGKFSAQDTLLVSAVLAAATIGLQATTWARLYSSAFYALNDTVAPLRLAMVRVATGISLGWWLMRMGPQWLHVDAIWGAAFLSGGSGIAAWLESILLRRQLQKRIGRIVFDRDFAKRVLLAAGVASVAAQTMQWVVSTLPMHFAIRSILVLLCFGAVYLAVAIAAGIPQAKRFLPRR